MVSTWIRATALGLALSSAAWAEEYGEIAMAEMAGKKHEYLTKLIFQPIANSGDADTVTMKDKPSDAQTSLEKN